MQNIIAFVSDFGLDDTWAGICHAVIHEACPQARIVNLAHQIPPFDIRKGAVVTASGVWQLPHAIHLAVVDPGVSGNRQNICIVTRRGTRLIGPDNGLLIPATWRSGGIAEAFAIVPSQLDRQPPSPTFHARDVLAPAAAALACGVDPRALGEPMTPDQLADAPFPRARLEADFVVAEALDVDRFGSVRIGISQDEMGSLGLSVGRVQLSVGHRVLDVPFSRTYAEVEAGQPVLLADASGWLTLAVRSGSAAERYGIEPGELARIRCLTG